MATKWTRTLIPTARQVPADAEVPSHQLMLRAGLIHRLGSGIYDYLPSGWRSLRKAMQIVREEMDRAGAVEVFLPALQPVELWEKTGRRADYGDVLFVVEDQHGRQQALGPTHEEVVTELVAAHVRSYRDLPLTFYQIQTKFRDEYRPRFGILRSREFQMKDAYSFDIDAAGLENSYQTLYDAYCRIFERCGLPYEVVEAESGPIGGSASHEFMVPSPTGEDTVLKSDKGNYAANVEKCAVGEHPYTLQGPPTGDLDVVETPDCGTIEDVCAFFKKKLGSKLRPQNMLKTLIYQSEGDRPWVVAVVRGDHEVNESKLRARAPGRIELADENRARDGGFAIGYVGPHVCKGRDDLLLVVDPSAAADQFWVTGANTAGHHVRHFNWQRDVAAHKANLGHDGLLVGDIRHAVDGDPSPKNDGGVLRQTKGIEIGHVFKLGTKYTEALGAFVLDEHNQRQPLVMGCYGIGVNRILAAAIEREGGHDKDGIIWPLSIAPYSVLITPLALEGQAVQVTDRLAMEIEAAGHDVLIDDRPERPGVKFKDADLIGVPLRITIGEKGLKDGKVELKPRQAPRAELIGVDQAATRALELLDTAP